MPTANKKGRWKAMGNLKITKEQIEKIVDENVDEALELLVNALQTPSPTGAENLMGETMCRWLDKVGIKYNVYTYNNNQPNIIAELSGDGEKSFVFNGHMDVFPGYDNENSDYNPWSGEIKDGKIYGRGASDMKGGNCAAFMAMHLLNKLGWKPAGKVLLTLVSDEERGGKYGTLSLIKEGLIKADYGISMEPSGFQTCVNHGGVYPFKVTVYGDGGIASEDVPNSEIDSFNVYGGEDAIHKIVKAVYELNKNIIRKRKNVRGMISHMSITNIHGGTPNVINNHCREAFLLIDRRYIPGETPESIRTEIVDALEGVKKYDPYFVYKVEGPVEPDCPFLDIAEDSIVVEALDRAHEELFGGKTVHRTMLAGSDAAYISKYCNTNIPWFGPGAHEYGIAAKDEYIPIENYINCIKMYMHVLIDIMS